MAYNHLAIFYTHNEIDENVLRLSLNHFCRMINNKHLPLASKGVIISCEPIYSLLELNEATNIVNLIAPNHIRNKGHISIIEKIIMGIESSSANFISLHEHDVLYPEDYLLICQELLMTYSNAFDYIAYDFILGVNKTGYLDRTINDYPLSCLSFPAETLKHHLLIKKDEIIQNDGWCYLEPGYAGSAGKHLKSLIAGGACTDPIVHINMDGTNNNHHFTNHFLTYANISTKGFTEWPGDLSYLFV